MKKFFFAIAVAGAAILALSCNRLENQTGDETGTLYGTWVMDSYTFELGGSKDDKSGTIPIVIPYFKNTTLTLSENLRAWAGMGLQGDWSNYSNDSQKKQLVIDRMIVAVLHGLGRIVCIVRIITAQTIHTIFIIEDIIIFVLFN